jgi:hypothetical protein
MADKKISELTAATTPLAGTEVLPIVQSNSTKKVAISDLTAGRAISASEVTVSTLTSGRVPYVGTSGKLSDTTNFQWDVSNNLLGIGISPAYTLHVARSSAGFIGAFRATDVTASAQMIIAGNSQGDLIAASTTTGNGLIYADSGKTLSLGANGSTSARLTVTTAGDVSIPSNNLVIGTAGKGIDFTQSTNAAGMTSELLNDYEEGTFTPTYVGSVTPGTVTYTTQLGRYVKIGSQVYVTIQLAWSAHSGSSGNATVGGLPYANGSVATPLSMIPFSLDAAVTTVQVCFVDAAGSTILMRQYALTGTTTISGSSVSNAGTLLISGSYTTT